MTAIERATEYYARMLAELGVNLNEVIETPSRYVKFLAEHLTEVEFNFTTFEPPASNWPTGMIVQGPIPFSSLCEHHVLPMYGHAVVAYLPNYRIAGLSKLARAVASCSKGLQLQERIGGNIAGLLSKRLNTQDVAVVIRAAHMCMSIRGARVHDTYTTTEDLRGVFATDPSTRAEFLAIARSELKSP